MDKPKKKPDELHITTTDKRLRQFREVAQSGKTSRVSLNPELMRAHEKAQERKSTRPTKGEAKPRQDFDNLRERMKKHTDLKNKDIHHSVFPIHERTKEALDPNNHQVADRAPLKTGTGKPPHVQLHQATGGESLHTRKGMNRKMAFGDHPSLQRDFDYQNPTDRVPLEKVKAEIKKYRKSRGE